MSDNRVKVSVPRGQVIGYFINPSIENLCGEEWEIIGEFVDVEGRPYDRIEFNPEALPYELDLSAFSGHKHKQLKKAYVQRGRQPVRMTAISP